MSRLAALTLAVMATLATAGGNRIWSERFGALTSTVGGDWLSRPVMTLGTTDVLDIGFDELSHDYHRLTYRIELCTPDWQVAQDVFENDWLEGWNDNPIDDYETSINTTVDYTHYRLQIPNDRCRLKMGGNYRLTVCDEDAGGERVLAVEFYVVNPLMSVALEATTNTDIDHNVSHQQVNLRVAYNNVRISRMDEELQTVVMQNWREDNARWNVPPRYVSATGLQWDHERRYIFDAGNEYHKFEVLDVSHPTMGIERIAWDGEAYQAYPYPTGVRRNYLTDVDADGAFIIRNSEMRDINTTCDYVYVNYELRTPYCGDVYIDGLWTDRADRATYRMTYDTADGAYRASVLQKQGYYSYQYLLEDGTLAPSEGNFFQTENRYQAMVYHRAIGQRAWQLVGFRSVMLR